MNYKLKITISLLIVALVTSISVGCSKAKNQTDTNTVNIVALMKAKQGKADELRNALLAVVEPTHSETGCITYNLYEEKDGSIFLYEVWRSQEDLDQHLQKPYLKDLIGKLDTLLYGKNDAHFGKLISK